MGSLVFPIALLAVGVVGFANQRGGTCTLAAVEEIVAEGRYSQLLALFEASLWVAGGLVLFAAFGWFTELPANYAAGIVTIVGGALFGVGAFINRACAFGSLARLGSGEWAYLATPVGLYLGILLTSHVPLPGRLAGSSILLGTPFWLGIVVTAILLARLFSHGRRVQRSGRAGLSNAWSPHLATTVIGIGFVISLAAAGPWTYSSFLGDLATGTERGVMPRIALNLALLGGAIVGGWSAGRLHIVRPDGASLVRCLVGGTIMGMGSRLIPGNNTTLVLVGLPLLHSYAWLAIVSMMLTMYGAIRLSR